MGYLCLFIHVLFEKTMFYLYFSLFNKNIHEVKNIAIRIVSCHTYRIVKMCIVTSLITRLPFGWISGQQTGNGTLPVGSAQIIYKITFFNLLHITLDFNVFRCFKNEIYSNMIFLGTKYGSMSRGPTF